MCDREVSETATRECLRVSLLPSCSRCLLAYFEFRQEDRRVERRLMIEATLTLLVVMIDPRIPRRNRCAKRRTRKMLHGEMLKAA